MCVFWIEREGEELVRLSSGISLFFSFRGINDMHIVYVALPVSLACCEEAHRKINKQKSQIVLFFF